MSQTVDIIAESNPTQTPVLLLFPGLAIFLGVGTLETVEWRESLGYMLAGFCLFISEVFPLLWSIEQGFRKEFCKLSHNTMARGRGSAWTH